MFSRVPLPISLSHSGTGKSPPSPTRRREALDPPPRAGCPPRRAPRAAHQPDGLVLHDRCAVCALPSLSIAIRKAERFAPLRPSTSPPMEMAVFIHGSGIDSGGPFYQIGSLGVRGSGGTPHHHCRPLHEYTRTHTLAHTQSARRVFGANHLLAAHNTRSRSTQEGGGGFPMTKLSADEYQ